MSYRVKVEPSGHEFPVADRQTLLDAALQHGVNLPYGCRIGSCGSCEARLISGEIDYDGPLPIGLDAASAEQGAVLLCQAFARSDITLGSRELTRSEQMAIKNLPARVVDIQRLNHDVVQLTLKTPDSDSLQYLPGQYLEILLQDGRRRAFSMANAPRNDALIELQIRAVPGGEFTQYALNDLQPKTLLCIEGPFGDFYLREDSPRPVLMMAGGSGFAPVKAMLEHAFDIGLERPIHLLWGARTRPDLYLDQLPRQWAAQQPTFQYTPVLSKPREDDDWQGETGLVLGSLLQHYPEPAGYDIYMSGPPAMIEAARTALEGHGVPAEQIFFDSFEYARDRQAG